MPPSPPSAGLSASRSAGAIRGLATPEKYAGVHPLVRSTSGTPAYKAVASPTRHAFSPSALRPGGAPPACGGYRPATCRPAVGASTEFLASPSAWGSVGGGGSLAVTRELLDACVAPAEQARLLQQVRELSRECRQLSDARQAEDERLEKQKADLAEFQDLRDSTAATVDGLERQLAEARAALADAEHASSVLERGAEEMRTQLAFVAHVEAEQRQRLRGALLAADQASAGLAAEREKVASLAEWLWETDPKLQGTFRAQAASASSVAALGLEFVEARAQAQGAQQIEREARARAQQVALGLQRAKDELDALSTEITGLQSRRLSYEGAAALHTELAQVRVGAVSAELEKACEEAAGSAETARELLALGREVEAQRALIAGCAHVEKAAMEAAHRERGEEARQAALAAQMVAKTQAVAERRSAEAQLREGERKSVEAAAQLAHAELTDDLSRSQAVVASASNNLDAIYRQLKDLHSVGEQLRISERAAAAAAADMKEKAASRQAAHGSVEKRLGAALVDVEAAQRRASVAAADGAAAAVIPEREHRHLAEEIRRLESTQTLKAEVAKAEQAQRSDVERRLRAELAAVERAWCEQRTELEARGAEAARQVLKADAERQDAEVLLQEAEAAWRRFEGARDRRGWHLARQLESALTSGARQEAAAREAADGLRNELDALVPEHGRAQCLVRNAEALNAGLRAQLQAMR